MSTILRSPMRFTSALLAALSGVAQKLNPPEGLKPKLPVLQAYYPYPRPGRSGVPAARRIKAKQRMRPSR